MQRRCEDEQQHGSSGSGGGSGISSRGGGDSSGGSSGSGGGSGSSRGGGNSSGGSSSICSGGGSGRRHSAPEASPVAPVAARRLMAESCASFLRACALPVATSTARMDSSAAQQGKERGPRREAARRGGGGSGGASSASSAGFHQCMALQCMARAYLKCGTAGPTSGACVHEVAAAAKPHRPAAAAVRLRAEVLAARLGVSRSVSGAVTPGRMHHRQPDASTLGANGAHALRGGGGGGGTRTLPRTFTLCR